MRNYADVRERGARALRARLQRPKRLLPKGAGLVAVEHVFRREGRELATVRVTRGEANPGMIALAGDGRRWQIVALGTVSPVEWARGRRTIVLASLDGSNWPLQRGDILTLTPGGETRP